MHVTGRPSLLDEVRTMRQLDDLIEDQEARLAPKEPWSLPRKASAMFDAYLNLIQGFEIPLGSIDGVFKLGQNKSPADMEAQAGAFRARGTDSMERLAEYIERHNNIERKPPGRPGKKDPTAAG